MSTVPFQTIPQNLRLPLFFAEVNNSAANSGQQTQRALVIGQILSAGAAAPNIPIISQGASDAIAQGGAGSMLALMTAAYLAADNFGELWYLPLSDDGSSVAAAGTATITGAPTAAGVVSLYIGGFKISVAVATTDTPTTIAAAIVAAVTANPNLPVSAAAAAGVVTFTAKNKGAAGNDIDLRINYGGSAAGEATPAGVTIVFVAMASGATNPTLTTALSNLGDKPFDFIICPYTDPTSLNALQALLNDTTGRWSWNSQVYGHVFAAQRGTYSGLVTAGNARNNQHETILGFSGSPTPNWLIAADLAGTAAVSLRTDPGVPLQTLALSTMQAPPLASQFTLSERNTLLFDGISTFTVAQDGTVALENVITTYQKNAFNQADNSYLEIETMFLLMFVLRDLASVITSKFSRVKLAADGTRFAPGSALVTPSTIRACIIAEYQTLEFNGYVQDSTDFAANLIVQQNATNPNRVDVLWPGELINQLRTVALLAQFRL
ncbi:phage tail protein [Rhodanobacter sp. B04]|uniref:phage tail sheath subtilisin-like domain-containing protein n=1 Tax=Rhodanobacter sp. B04 TaxID=1945860 RepID=UPI0009855108|nr:phage tail sheath subtilisin-like domain-containing protein [Rhodanobacter sp. B04]OOG61448.1 phage tail protein [Rhodanobacter sp. B04]